MTDIKDDLHKVLEIDCPKEEQKIVTFIQKTIKELHKDGAVIGLSGGLDSSVCAYLLTRALGKKKVLAVLLPERDSDSVNYEHAHLVAKTLGLETIEHDMTKTLQEIGVYEIGPKKLENKDEEAKFLKKSMTEQSFFGDYVYHDLLGLYYGAPISIKWKIAAMIAKKRIYTEFAFQLSKVRLRMVYLYFFANQQNYAVIGTTDKSEYSTGIYCNYGDGANDMQILRHLYKTQIKQLAYYLQLSPEIINKPHSGDLYGNMPHSARLGMNYEELDMVLVGMDKRYSDEKLTEIVPQKGIESIKQLKKVADLVRKLPLSLNNQ